MHFPDPETTPSPLLNLPRALCASTAGTDPLAPFPPPPLLSSRAPLMPLVARSRALLCHSFPRPPRPLPHVDPRAAPNDRQLAAKKSV